MECAGDRAKEQIYGQFDGHVGVDRLRTKTIKSSKSREEDGAGKHVLLPWRRGNCVTCLPR